MGNTDRFFFERFGLTEANLSSYLGAALSEGGEYADLYFEHTTSSSLLVDESLVKTATEGISMGCGIRVVAGEQTGYAYTDDLAPEKITKVAEPEEIAALVGFIVGPMGRSLHGSLIDIDGGSTKTI